MNEESSPVSGSSSEIEFLRQLLRAPAERPAALDVAGDGALYGNPRFLVRQCLGRGGFGTVYEVIDRRRNATVALKALHRTDPGSLYRFKQEFRALQAVQHPHLVQLYELFADGDRWYFTMERVRGASFIEAVRARRVSPEELLPGDSDEAASAPREAGGDRRDDEEEAPLAGGEGAVDRARLVDALAQLADGLAALHAAGHVHRDIKPQNVLCTAEGRVVILDFGLLRDAAAEATRSTAEVLGTPEYMAPEQAAGAGPSPASDWYSVGVLLYEALAGRRPFAGPPLEILGRKQVEDPPPLPPSAPDELAALCSELLARDPARRPSGEEVVRRIAALREREAGASIALAAGASPPPARREAGLAAAATPLVGREAALAALDEALAAIAESRPVVVRCHGESGIGKSTLVRQFLRRARERDPELVVLAARCFAHEQIPYKALDGIVDALARHLGRLPRAHAENVVPRDAAALARVFPTLLDVPAILEAPRRAPVDPRDLQRAALAAFRELLQRLSDRRRVVIYIDDLQWGDSDSIAFLAEAIRPPDAAPLLLCLSHRDREEALNPALRALDETLAGAAFAEVRVVDVALRELTRGEAVGLAASLLPPGADPALASAIAEEARGSPYYLHELARHAQGGGAGGLTVEAAISGRAARLPSEGRRLLEVVCVAGQPLSRACAARAAGISDERAVEIDGTDGAAGEPAVVARLRAERLVRVVRGGEREELVAYHDRVRESVIAAIDPQREEAHHRALAEALATVGPAEPERLLHHLRRGGESERAARYAVVAARQAHDALAFAHAISLYEEALKLASLSQDERRDLLEALGAARAAAGRPVAAAEAYLRAAEGAPAPRALALGRQALWLRFASGDFEAASHVAGDLVRAAKLKWPATPRRALLSLLWLRLLVALRGLRYDERPAREVPPEDLLRLDVLHALASITPVDPLRGAGFHARYLLAALDAGEPLRLARALGMEAMFAAGRGARRRAARVLAEAERLSDALDEPSLIGQLAVVRGTMLLERGRWKEGGGEMARAISIFEERAPGFRVIADLARSQLVLALFWQGALGELAARLPALLDDARARGNRLFDTVLRHMHGIVALAVGRVDVAEDELREMDARHRHPGGFRRDALSTIGLGALLALHRGDGAAAWARIESRWREFRRSGVARATIPRVWVRATRALAALASCDAGAPRGARLREAARLSRALLREKLPWAEAYALAIRAGIASRRGRRDEAIDAAERAEEMFAAANMRMYAAAVRRRRAAWHDGAARDALCAEADAAMRAEGVHDPERFAAMLVPI